MSTLSTKTEALKQMDVLNLWASICGSTLDAMEIPWDCQVEETSESVEFRINFSESSSPAEQSKWMGAINWATDTMRNFVCKGTAKNGDPINKEGLYFDAYRGEFLSLWVQLPRDTVMSAFAQGVPVLDYLGFVPHESLDAAMDPME